MQPFRRCSEDLSIIDGTLLLSARTNESWVSRQLSDISYSIHLDSGKSLIRHINHVWRGGSPEISDSTGEDEDPGWTFHEPATPEAAVTPPIPEAAVAALSPIVVSDEAHSPADRASETQLDRPIPARPVRNRVVPHRLVLDPSANTYAQW